MAWVPNPLRHIAKEGRDLRDPGVTSCPPRPPDLPADLARSGGPLTGRRRDWLSPRQQRDRRPRTGDVLGPDRSSAEEGIVYAEIDAAVARASRQQFRCGWSLTAAAMCCAWPWTPTPRDRSPHSAAIKRPRNRCGRPARPVLPASQAG